MTSSTNDIPPPPSHNADGRSTSTSTTSYNQSKQQQLDLLRRFPTVTNPNRKEGTPRVNHISFICGLIAGITQAGIFNPMDRALYLSIKNEIPFLRWENFQHPYQGFLQSVGHRALSGGLYYPLEHFFMNLLASSSSENGRNGGGGRGGGRTTTRPLLQSDDTNTKNKLSRPTKMDHSTSSIHHFLSGIAAGTVNALIINPIAAVKYKTWGREVNRGIGIEIYDMLRKGGLRPFANGLIPTVLRDLVFGGCYTFLRLEFTYRLHIQDEYQWTSNMVAAALATVLSGPFNLARNVQYATKSRHIADPVRDVFRNLIQETQQRPTIWLQCKYIQNRLRLGWGTARVALGMAFGHAMYDQLHGMYEEKLKQQNKEGRVKYR